MLLYALVPFCSRQKVAPLRCMTPQFACQLAAIELASFEIPALLNPKFIHSILGVGDLKENLYFPLFALRESILTYAEVRYEQPSRFTLPES